MPFGGGLATSIALIVIAGLAIFAFVRGRGRIGPVIGVVAAGLVLFVAFNPSLIQQGSDAFGNFFTWGFSQFK